MTSEEARELFTDAHDGALDEAQRGEFEAALTADPALRAEYEELESLLGGAPLALSSEEPDLLGGVQRKLRERSKGRFYRDRFAERGKTSWMPLLMGVLMLVVLGAAWFALSFAELAQ